MTQYVVVYVFGDRLKPALAYLSDEDNRIDIHYAYSRATKYDDINQAYHLLNRSFYTNDHLRVEEAT